MKLCFLTAVKSQICQITSSVLFKQSRPARGAHHADGFAGSHVVVVGVPPLEFWVLAVLQDVLLALEVRVVVADPGSALHTDRVHPEETETGSRCYPAEVLSLMLKPSAGLTGQNFFILRPSTIICCSDAVMELR